MANLIASFQPELTLDPSGAGAERFLASVSERAEQEYLQSARYLFLVAEHEDDFAGFIGIRDNTHLFHLFVARAYQRLGLARRLWEDAREESRRRGNPGEFTVNSSLNAIAVYRAFGFTPSRTVETADGIAFQPMTLALEAK